MGSLIDNFGNFVDDLASRDPEKAKNLLVTGYRFERLRLKTIANKGLPPFRKYLPSLMMDNIINSLSNSKKSAMVSIFVPCEPLAAMGITPYSLEGLSSYITGTNMHGGCLEECKKKGFPETLCSYHRVYIGAAERQLMPKPPFIIYSNLACDANQITFKYLAEKFSIPSFYIDVPYNQNHESVLYVALQLRKMVNFIETCTGQKMSEEAFAKAIKRSKNTIDNYKNYLYNQKTKYVKGDITSEMYMAVTNHILLGTKEQENLSRMCLENIDAAPNNKGLKLLWVHTIPFWQEPLRNLFNFNENVHICACDMAYENMLPIDLDNPYESLARRMVYSPYNSDSDSRIKPSLKIAKEIEVDGIVYFCHWGCKSTIGSAQIAKEEFEANGFPTLILDGDCCDPRNSSDGQVSTRIGAFIEILERRKQSDSLYL